MARANLAKVAKQEEVPSASSCFFRARFFVLARQRVAERWQTLSRLCSRQNGSPRQMLHELSHRALSRQLRSSLQSSTVLCSTVKDPLPSSREGPQGSRICRPKTLHLVHLAALAVSTEFSQSPGQKRWVKYFAVQLVPFSVGSSAQPWSHQARFTWRLAPFRYEGFMGHT